MPRKHNTELPGAQALRQMPAQTYFKYSVE